MWCSHIALTVSLLKAKQLHFAGITVSARGFKQLVSQTFCSVKCIIFLQGTVWVPLSLIHRSIMLSVWYFVCMSVCVWRWVKERETQRDWERNRELLETHKLCSRVCSSYWRLVSKTLPFLGQNDYGALCVQFHLNPLFTTCVQYTVYPIMCVNK